MATSNGTVEVDGGTLAYDEAGDGPAVVLLHAGLLDRRMWDGQWAALAEGHRVVRYDARGHGASSTPAGRQCHYDDLHRLIGTLGLDAPVLVGNSLGARTAVDHALEHPGVARALVLIGPGVSGMAFLDPYIEEIGARVDSALGAGDVDGAVEGVLRMWTDGPHRQPADLDPDMRATAGRMIAETIRAHHLGVPPWEHEEAGAIDRLGALDLPVEVLIGALDGADILTLGDHIEREVFGATQQRWADVGHLVPLERPAELATALLTLLERD